MSILDSTIYIKVELRPCMIKKQKALFHKWITDSTSLQALGIVELENGAVAVAYPYEITFCDNLVSQYAFPEEQEED